MQIASMRHGSRLLEFGGFPTTRLFHAGLLRNMHTRSAASACRFVA